MSIQERQRDLARRAAAGEDGARAELIRSAVRLAQHYGGRYRRWPRVADPEDLVQSAFVGLCKAVDRFIDDPDQRLADLVWYYSRSEIGRTLVTVEPVLTIHRGDQHSYRISRKILRGIFAAGRDHYTEGLRPGAVAAEIDESDHVENVEAMIVGMRGRGPILKNGSMLRSPSETAKRRRVGEDVDRLLRAIENPRDRGIMMAHYGIGGPQRSGQEIGDWYGISREAVRKIIDRTTDEIRSRP